MLLKLPSLIYVNSMLLKLPNNMKLNLNIFIGEELWQNTPPIRNSISLKRSHLRREKLPRFKILNKLWGETIFCHSFHFNTNSFLFDGTMKAWLFTCSKVVISDWGLSKNNFLQETWLSDSNEVCILVVSNQNYCEFLQWVIVSYRDSRRHPWPIAVTTGINIRGDGNEQ